MEGIEKNRFAARKKSLAFQKQKLIFVLFTLPPVLLYVAFFIYPTITGVYYSMTDWDGFSKKFNFIGLDNYITILKDSRFLNSISFTLYYTVLDVVLKLLIALFLAILLSGKVKWRGFMRSVYFFPAVLSLIAVGLIFNQIFYTVLPAIGEALDIEWLKDNLLADKSTAVYGIVFTNLWQGVAIPMVIFMAGLASVPQDLREAAIIDGAGPFQRFRSITLPFLIPMLNVNLIIAIKGAITVFDYIVAMTDGGPAQATESVGFLIYRHGLNEMKFGYGTAEAIYVFLLIAIISIVQIKLLNRKEAGQQ
ncbi:sugar ABC transporter permease [Paenibacillus albiflavus]|uniref:Sugar ABC transporter permease n=1 Tax=Paenibacillus albiflavus TaxID=2545760 RepID=A0A4R4ECT2_9BACL|nr:sugar ABC transporter permease [Paenibacillus albiflavus]TCZ77227.1 sugar ABC transporter permease [Paenibacillus albiflavus]